MTARPTYGRMEMLSPIDRPEELWLREFEYVSS